MQRRYELFWKIYGKALKLEVEFAFLYSAINTMAELIYAGKLYDDIGESARIIALEYSRGYAIAVKSHSPHCDIELNDEQYKVLAEKDISGNLSYVSGDSPIKVYHFHGATKGVDYIDSTFTSKSIDVISFLLENCQAEINVALAILKEQAE